MNGFVTLLIGAALGAAGMLWWVRQQAARPGDQRPTPTARAPGDQAPADRAPGDQGPAADHEMKALLEEVRSLRQDIDILKLNPSIGSAVNAALAHARDDLTYDKSSYAVAVKDAEFSPDYAVLVRPAGFSPDYAVAVKPADRPELDRLRPAELPPDYAVLVRPAGFEPDYGVLVKPASFPPDYAVLARPGQEPGDGPTPGPRT